MSDEQDPICVICSEPFSAHIETEKGPLTHPQESKRPRAMTGTTRLGAEKPTCGQCGSPMSFESFVRVNVSRRRRRKKIEYLRAALQEISDMLSCDVPCEPVIECVTCGIKRGGLCAGCIARNALEAEANV